MKTISLFLFCLFSCFNSFGSAADTAQINRLNQKAADYITASQFDSAMQTGSKALKMAQEANYKQGIATAFIKIGISYRNLGQPDSAMNCYVKALQVSEENNFDFGIASASNAIASMQGYTEKALQNFMRAAGIYEKIKDKKRLAATLNEIGNYYYNTDNNDKALEYYLKAYSLNHEIGNKNDEAVCLSNISTIYEAKGMHREALNYGVEGLKITVTEKNLNSMGYLLQCIAGAYEGMGKYDSSLIYLDKNLELSRSMNDPHGVLESYYGYSIVYSKLNNYKKAFDYQNLMYYLNDSLEQASNSLKFIEMQNKYEEQKKEKEMMLKNQERELKQQAEISRQKLIKNFSLIGLALLLVMAGVIFDKYRQKNKLNAKLSALNVQLGEKNQIIEKKQEEILASIRYAQRIQQNLLPTEKYIHKSLSRLNCN